MCQRGAVLEGPGDVFYTLPALCVIHVEVFETCSAHPVCVCGSPSRVYPTTRKGMRSAGSAATRRVSSSLARWPNTGTFQHACMMYMYVCSVCLYLFALLKKKNAATTEIYYCVPVPREKLLFVELYAGYLFRDNPRVVAVAMTLLLRAARPTCLDSSSKNIVVVVLD
jgi:hypothetical protein